MNTFSGNNFNRLISWKAVFYRINGIIHMNYSYLLVSLLILLTLSGYTACASNPQASVPSAATENISDSLLNTIPRITADELYQKIKNKSGLTIVDSRSGVDQLFGPGHIEGAIAVPIDEVVSGKWVPPADLAKEIVFYCSCPDEHTAVSAAMVLKTKGYTNVKALRGGYNAWVDAGYPIASGTK
jgi:rhodanese-related sulfurtransferase